MIAAAAALLLLASVHGQTAAAAGAAAGSDASAAPAVKRPASAAKPSAGKAAAAGAPTVVTSDRLEVDYAKNVAVFSGNVCIKDKSGDMWADKMIVTFNPTTREVREITATGNKVVIDAHGRKSQSRKAVYTARDGRILLTGDPQILHGPNAYAAERITIFKDQDRTIFEPRARMIFYSDQSSGLMDGMSGLPGASSPPARGGRE